MKSITNGWRFGTALAPVMLSSFGFLTLLDDYLDMPGKRGNDIEIPMQDGETFAPKYYSPKIMTFGMEITADNICDLDEKLDNLKALLGGRVQKYLSNTMFPGGERRALAEVTTPLGVTRDTDPLAARIVIVFKMTDPFMRSPVATSVSFSGAAYTLNNPGTADERRAIITLTGPLTAPTITNTTNGIAMQYNANLAGAGNVVVIDCGFYTTTPAAAVGNIIHTGDPAFMVLEPGDNDLTLTGGGGGTVKFDFYAPFL